MLLYRAGLPRRDLCGQGYRDSTERTRQVVVIPPLLLQRGAVGWLMDVLINSKVEGMSYGYERRVVGGTGMDLLLTALGG